MHKGKLAAQVAHASLGVFLKVKTPNVPGTPMHDWLSGSFFKAVLRVDSEEELLEIKRQCDEANIVNSLICDAGHTVFKEPTNTCLGIEPMYENKINKITGHLKLL